MWDLKIEGKYAETIDRGRFLLADVKEGADRIIIFASDVQLSILSASGGKQTARSTRRPSSSLKST